MISQVLKKLLWDFSDKDKDSAPELLLIRRSLVRGGADTLRNILHSYGKDKVKQVFYSMKNTEMSPKRFHYLKNYLLR